MNKRRLAELYVEKAKELSVSRRPVLRGGRVNIYDSSKLASRFKYKPPYISGGAEGDPMPVKKRNRGAIAYGVRELKGQRRPTGEEALKAHQVKYFGLHALSEDELVNYKNYVVAKRRENAVKRRENHKKKDEEAEVHVDHGQPEAALVVAEHQEQELEKEKEHLDATHEAVEAAIEESLEAGEIGPEVAENLHAENDENHADHVEEVQEKIEEVKEKIEEVKKEVVKKPAARKGGAKKKVTAQSKEITAAEFKTKVIEVLKSKGIDIPASKQTKITTSLRDTFSKKYENGRYRYNVILNEIARANVDGNKSADKKLTEKLKGHKFIK